ncbi:MAG: neutral/alkaline non-lysosomal ceramidase N-terminal domain-containing protein [Verrucomicrobiales bacterium]|nr:neutral/alkaline non-lysosomal ceramidase N-terminal domain-containing protein [Verrucomicrobiales bacterium]
MIEKPTHFVLTAFAALFLLPAIASAQLKAGLSSVDVTPQVWPVTLRGSFNPKKAESANDPLHARSFAIRNGEGRAVITIVDILFIAQDTVDAIKAEAAKRTGWKPTEMLIAGTHTHSAPSASGTGGGEAEIAFREHFFEGVVQSIELAIENLEPARLGFGSDEEPSEVFNRRWYLKDGTMPPNPFGGIDQVKMNPPRDLIEKPAGPTDPEVAVISIQRANGKPMGLFANYALHYVGSIPGGQVSADYFGEFARLVPFRIAGRTPPEDFVAMMSNGASGDINNIDFAGNRAPRAPFEQIQQVATKAADAAYRATRDIEYQTDLPVGMVERRVTLKNRKPDPELIEKSKRILEMTGDELKAEPRLASHYALRILNLADVADTTEVAIQAIRIGDQAIVAMPFEVLVEIGLDLKKRSPFPRTTIVEIANGAFGYLPPPHQHELGGYETWLGTSKMEKEASVILTKHLLEMLEELKSSPLQ